MARYFKLAPHRSGGAGKGCRIQPEQQPPSDDADQSMDHHTAALMLEKMNRIVIVNLLMQNLNKCRVFHYSSPH